MKYFIPELYVRNQSRDEATLDEAERLWAEAGDRYSAYLDTVRHEFPPGLKHLDSSYYLHDASVRAMGRRAGVFDITLQLDTPPRSLLTFTFDLVEEPTIDPTALNVLPSEYRSPDAVAWLYEECLRVPGDPPTWAMSILLSNGWEVRLHFHDVRVQEAQALLPRPQSGAADGVSAILAPTIS